MCSLVKKKGFKISNMEGWCLKISGTETAQQLRALVALAVGQGLNPRAHRAAGYHQWLYR